jgi:ribose 5-phosphate isomerase
MACLGSGSTAAFAVEALAARVAKGLDVVAIPTFERTAEQARLPPWPTAPRTRTPRSRMTVRLHQHPHQGRGAPPGHHFWHDD